MQSLFFPCMKERDKRGSARRVGDLDSNTCKRGSVGYSTSQPSNGVNGRHDKAVVI